MIIDTTQYHTSIYAICVMTSILAGFIVASILLVKQKSSKITILCSALLNIVLLGYCGLVFEFIVNIKSGYFGSEPADLITPNPQVDLSNENPLTGLISMMGLTSIGCAIGIIIGSYILSRIFKNTMIIKAYTTVLPLIYSIAKIGCFFGGCCGGQEYHGPMAVNYLRYGEYINPTLTFPVPLLESVVFMAIFVPMIILFNKLEFRTHIAINGILCCVAKFCIDFLRSSHVGQNISINQILCLVLLAMVILFFILSDKVFSRKAEICDL